MSLPPGFLDDLRGRVSLAQIVGRRVTWDTRKSNAAKGDWWAPCPFHQEKSASFHVDDRKGYYYCFGCQAKGDAVTFLRESEGLGFLEAVERLAKEAGVDMPARDPAAAARAEVRAGLSEAVEAAVRFYRMQLSSAAAAEARGYLTRRGLSPETQGRFELGYAGRDRHALFRHLTEKGFPPGVILEAGLARAPDDGGAPYDLFRERILFPIRDGRDRAIGFGGRAMAAEAKAKYLNSPETPLFDKGRTLFNFGPARTASAKSGALVVVEGYMDAIALAQVGIGHVVAPLGTAVTADQLGLMWRICDEPVIALDGDRAGQAAALRLAELALPLLAAGKGLRFALMPAGRDPDDVAREGGKRAVEALLEASRPMIDLLWARETEGATLDSPERRAALDGRLRALLGRINDPSLRAHWQAEIRARRAELFAPARKGAPGGGRRAGSFGGAGGRMQTARGGGGRRFAPPGPGDAPGGLSTTLASMLGRGDVGLEAAARGREAVILAGCLGHPELALAQEAALERATFVCADLAVIRDALLSCLDDHPETLVERVAARLGHDPRPRLLGEKAVRVMRNLRPGADPLSVAKIVGEALARHAALVARAMETAAAEREMMGPAGEDVTWRMLEVQRVAESVGASALSDSVDTNDRLSDLDTLQNALNELTSTKRKNH
jgi:DNA primase